MKTILIAVAMSVLLWSPLAEAKSKKSTAKYTTTYTYHKKTGYWTIKNKKRLSTLETIEKINGKFNKKWGLK